MAEYIKREEVCKLCDNQKEYCGKEKCPVYKAPATDAVEVVRCKDCKRRSQSVLDIKNAVWCREFRAVMANDDFCSHGERREGE